MSSIPEKPVYQSIPHSIFDYWIDRMRDARFQLPKDGEKVLGRIADLQREVLAWNKLHPKKADKTSLAISLNVQLEELREKRPTFGQLKLMSRALEKMKVGEPSVLQKDYSPLEQHVEERSKYLSEQNVNVRLDPFITKVTNSRDHYERVSNAVACMNEILAWKKINPDHPGLEGRLIACLDAVVEGNGWCIKLLSLGEISVIRKAIRALSEEPREEYSKLERLCERRIRRERLQPERESTYWTYRNIFPPYDSHRTRPPYD